jgi:DNA-binding LytR/AlgR family response regulator
MEWDISKQIGKRVAIVEKSKISYVDMENITHITCDGYVSTVHLVNGNDYFSAHLLIDYEKDNSHYGFLRVNRKTLVNIRHVTDTQRTQRILHIGNIVITVSKGKMSLLKKMSEL